MSSTTSTSTAELNIESREAIVNSAFRVVDENRNDEISTSEFDKFSGMVQNLFIVVSKGNMNLLDKLVHWLIQILNI